MNLDEIYITEIAYRRKQNKKEKYEIIDYFDTARENSKVRNYKRRASKSYDTYENKFIY